MQAWRNPRWLSTMSFARDRRLHGDVTFGWHSTNVAVHVINTVLVYGICLAKFSIVGASLGALVFAVHPTAIGAVGFISGRAASLCGSFYFASILAWACGAWWLAIPLILLARKCKEEALTAPLFIALAFGSWWIGIMLPLMFADMFCELKIKPKVAL